MKQLYNAPAREHVLNYSQEQMNMACPIAGTTVEINMFSQESFFNTDDEHPLYKMADPDETNIQKRLNKLFYECSDAIHQSGENSLEKEFEEFMNNLIIRSRRNDADGVVGKRVSMMPSNSKRRKTHGTEHYK